MKINTLGGTRKIQYKIATPSPDEIVGKKYMMWKVTNFNGCIYDAINGMEATHAKIDIEKGRIVMHGKESPFIGREIKYEELSIMELIN